MTVISVFVPGIPIPQGSMRGYVRNGRVAITSDNGKLRSWRVDVASALAEARGTAETTDSPVEVRVEFMFLRPSSHYGTRGLRPSAPPVPHTKPDLDKAVRAILDAGTTARVWTDDARVVSLRATKRYVAEVDQLPGAWITVTPYDWEAA